MPPEKPVNFTREMEKEMLNEKKPLEILEEKLKGNDLVTREAVKIKKEILNYAYAIEQYTINVKLEGDILVEAQNLVKKAHFEVEKNDPQNLGKLHKALADMTARLDDLVGKTLGIKPEMKPPIPVIEPDIEAEFAEKTTDTPRVKKDKDDTKPFRIITD